MADINLSYAPGTSLDQMVNFEVAGAIWSSLLDDDVDVNIYVEGTNTLAPNVIGGALPGVMANTAYEDIEEALQDDETSEDDEDAVKGLPDAKKGLEVNSNVDDKVTTDVMNVTTANAKAMGLASGSSKDLDGYILISDLSAHSDLGWDYDAGRSSAASAQKLDLMSVALHEIGHILGFVSGVDDPGWLTALKSGQPISDDKGSKSKSKDKDAKEDLDDALQYVNPLDLFRFSSASVDDKGKGIQDLSIGGDPYFSIDGGETKLADFSNGKAVEFGGDGYQGSHWDMGVGIMDPALAPGIRREISDMDLRAFDVIGWDRTDADPFAATTSAPTSSVNGTYKVESQGGTSNGKVLSLATSGSNKTGAATFNFAGEAGLYDVVIGYIDEDDGASQLKVQHGSNVLDSWLLDDVQAGWQYDSRTVAQELFINPGENFTITGTSNQGEFARIDYLEFRPTGQAVRVEAESIDTNYDIERIDDASGGKVWSLYRESDNETGHGSFQFDGPAGYYKIDIGYFDEIDGTSKLSIKKGSATLDSWTLDQYTGSDEADAQAFQSRLVADQMYISPGETFTIHGTENNGEHLRVDYIDFTPVGSSVRVEAENMTVVGGGDSSPQPTSGLGLLVEQAKANLASQINKSVDWLEANTNGAADKITKDRWKDVDKLLTASGEVYEWGSRKKGSRSSRYQELVNVFEQQGLFSKLDTDRYASDKGEAGDAIIGSREGQALVGTTTESSPSDPAVDLNIPLQGPSQNGSTYSAPNLGVFGPPTHSFNGDTHFGQGTGVHSLSPDNSSSFGVGLTENNSNTILPTGLDNGLDTDILMLSGQALVDALLTR